MNLQVIYICIKIKNRENETKFSVAFRINILKTIIDYVKFKFFTRVDQALHLYNTTEYVKNLSSKV